MNKIPSRQSIGSWLAVTVLAAAVLVGCGPGGGPEPKTQEKNVAYAKSLRSYFVKGNGDYAQLSEADKAEFVKLSGGEELAKQNWNLMKNGPGAVDRNTATPAANGGTTGGATGGTTGQ